MKRSRRAQEPTQTNPEGFLPDDHVLGKEDYNAAGEVWVKFCDKQPVSDADWELVRLVDDERRFRTVLGLHPSVGALRAQHRKQRRQMYLDRYRAAAQMPNTLYDGSFVTASRVKETDPARYRELMRRQRLAVEQGIVELDVEEARHGF